MSLNLHKVLYLYKTPSKFYIQPVEQTNEALIIDRQTGEVTVNNMFSVGLLPANATSCLIYGIIGIKRLINCYCLMVITKATQIGNINDEPVFKMDQAQVIPFDLDVVESNEGQTYWNRTYISMLEDVLKMPNYYFSYSYDLTNSLQRTNNLTNHKISCADNRAHCYYDNRFLWNRHVMDYFDRFGGLADRYRLPFILGFISVNSISIGHGLNYILISRRATKRAGTRFNCRGIDHDGNVANFVETEQIVEEYGQTTTSFVQVRGSIPLFWSQKTDYRYKPAIEIAPNYDHFQPMKKHFDELYIQYGDVSVVNLIDHKGHEGNLEAEFGYQIGLLQKAYNKQSPSYHYFDFHKECSKMRWHRLSILLDRLKKEIESFGYFEIRGGKVTSVQQGIIRSNCIDSLDRTNVVQSMIAHHILDLQLVKFKTVPSNTCLTNYNDFLNIFKNTWADNADALSIQYAGTPALKTDFTRTGQRTQSGLVKDGINSLTRYVSNNFFDSYRQDAMDLLLGNYEGFPSPLYRPMELTSYTSTLPVTFVMLTLVILYVYLRY